MLAISPLINCTPGERAGDASASNLLVADDFSADFDFNFSELFAGFDDGEALPGLEADFPSPDTVGVEAEILECGDGVEKDGARVAAEEEETVSIVHEEIMEDESTKMSSEVNSSTPVGERGRKPSAGPGKCSIGKRKMKVDWTPELHRQFVQAVEQIGVQKAVPSRILELMGIDCLTRHNVASHLQKYRSHRKHMLVREAESTSWTQRSKVYPMATTIPTRNNTGVKQKINPWSAPSMGFPSSAPHPLHMHSFRPLHVWGHPTMDQSLAHMWHPKHLFPMRPAPSPSWVAPHPPFQHPPFLPHASPWHPQFSRGTICPGAPCFPEQSSTMRFPTPPVPEIPPHTMYRPENALPAATPPTREPTKQAGWQLQHDVHPSNESIDEAIEEVLAQPWLPVPLGLKPPSLESVMEELQKQGISNVPMCI